MLATVGIIILYAKRRFLDIAKQASIDPSGLPRRNQAAERKIRAEIVIGSLRADAR